MEGWGTQEEWNDDIFVKSLIFTRRHRDTKKAVLKMKGISLCGFEAQCGPLLGHCVRIHFLGEHWNTGMIKGERRNINRGFKKLEVWQDAISLYVLASKILSHFPFELKKVAANALDAVHSISRNIAEGYCRKSLKEYLNFLNIALASCGEFHSCYESVKQAGQITQVQYDELDQMHYQVENKLIRLIMSLQKKQREGTWEDSFVAERDGGMKGAE